MPSAAIPAATAAARRGIVQVLSSALLLTLIQTSYFIKNKKQNQNKTGAPMLLQTTLVIALVK